MVDLIRFVCPACSQKLSVEPRFAGVATNCPMCRQPLTVPGGATSAARPVRQAASVAAATPRAVAATIYCPACGALNRENDFRCTSCGSDLHQTVSGNVADPFGGLIPYKNVTALWAYYLGVFSLIPGLGLLLTIPAIVLGAIGLNTSHAHPEAKGAAHAWAGIIIGIIMLVLYIGGIVLLFNLHH